MKQIIETFNLKFDFSTFIINNVKFHITKYSFIKTSIDWNQNIESVQIKNYNK